MSLLSRLPLIALLLTIPAIARPFVLPEGLSMVDRKRFEPFQSFQIKGDKMVENLIRKVEGIGDHPAILMWGLGNEVHLDEPDLRLVNRMSLEIHRRFPHHLTSLTMVNAKPEAIVAVKKSAPDLDVLGIQSYSRGAVRGAIKKTSDAWGITRWGLYEADPKV